MNTVVVAEASDPVQAAIWVDALRDGGIEASSYERGVGAALGGAATPGFARYPIVVGEGDIARARSIIADISGASALAPVEDRAAKAAARQRALVLLVLVVVTAIGATLLVRALG